MRLKASQESRAEAEEALASSAVLDAKAVSSFDVESSDLAANTDALTRRIAALKKDVAWSSFLSERRWIFHPQGGDEPELCVGDERSMLWSSLSGNDPEHCATGASTLMAETAEVRHELNALTMRTPLSDPCRGNTSSQNVERVA